MAWNAVLTNDGQALMQQWLNSGYTMQITGAKGGTSRVDVELLMQQTNVSGTAHTLSIVRYDRQFPALPYSILYVDVQVRPESSAYTLTQIGVFAKLMNGNTQVVGEKLLAIYQAESGSEVDVPSTSVMADYVYEYNAGLNINFSGTLAVNIDPGALVSRADLDAALAALVVRRVRKVETIASSAWHAPGTTWTQDGKSFTAPAGLYACAVAVDDVTEVSVIMESWIDAGDDFVPDAIDYETMDGGWVFLTTASALGISIDLGMMILI